MYCVETLLRVWKWSGCVAVDADVDMGVTVGLHQGVGVGMGIGERFVIRVRERWTVPPFPPRQADGPPSSVRSWPPE